ncbi:MAG TPA: hypothetical protein DDW34_05500 [Clostridium sp.]|nr:hypothetical protein [Clostridium sp.]
MIFLINFHIKKQFFVKTFLPQDSIWFFIFCFHQQNEKCAKKICKKNEVFLFSLLSLISLTDCVILIHIIFMGRMRE